MGICRRDNLVFGIQGRLAVGRVRRRRAKNIFQAMALCRDRGKYSILGELKLVLFGCTVLSKDYILVTNGAGKVRAL